MSKKVLFLGSFKPSFIEEKVKDMHKTSEKSGNSVEFVVIIVGGATENPEKVAQMTRKYNIPVEIWVPKGQSDLELGKEILEFHKIRRSYPLPETIKRMFSTYLDLCFVGKTDILVPESDKVDIILEEMPEKTYVAWDLELANTNIPEDFSGDLFEYSPLQISCGAVAYRDDSGKVITKFWSGTPHMSKDEISEMLVFLKDLQEKGKIILSFNGLQFDFRVCAENTGFYDLCGEMALNHYDLMYDVFMRKGYFVGLDSILKFHKMSKVHEVTLNDGTILDDMGGEKAATLWKEGEYDAVLEYLKGDVTELLKVAEIVERRQKIEWHSRKGNYMKVPTDMPLVSEGLREIKEPNNSWMDDPVTREDTLKWIKENTDL